MAKYWSFGFVYPKKYTHSPAKKNHAEKKPQHVNRLRFSLNTNQHIYSKVVNPKLPVLGHGPKVSERKIISCFVYSVDVTLL